MMSGLPNPPGRGQSALAAVMLGVLLASAGAAWWLVQSRTVGPRQLGAEILRQVRTGRLADHWPTGPQADFLGVDRAGTQVAGLRSKRRREDGKYLGAKTTWRKTPLGQVVYVEKWEISADAATGKYSGPTGPPGGRTEILLEGGRVTVRRTAPGGTVEASAPAPDNYIPEGLTWLVVRLAAAGGRRAAFKAILNSEAISDGKVRFTSVTMTPLGPGRLGQETRTSKYGDSKIYHLDTAGKITRIEDRRRIEDPNDDITYTLVAATD